MHEREQLSGPQESHGFLLHLLFIRRYRFHTYLPCLPCSPLQDMSAKHRGVKGKICYNLDYGRFNESGFLSFMESKMEIHLSWFFLLLLYKAKNKNRRKRLEESAFYLPSSPCFDKTPFHPYDYPRQPDYEDQRETRSYSWKMEVSDAHHLVRKMTLTRFVFLIFLTLPLFLPLFFFHSFLYFFLSFFMTSAKEF